MCVKPSLLDSMAQGQVCNKPLGHSHSCIPCHLCSSLLPRHLRAPQLAEETEAVAGTPYARYLSEELPLAALCPPTAEAHDPVEDARAALDLALLKIERGPSYGVASSSDGGEKLPAVLTAHGRQGRVVAGWATILFH